MPDPKPNDDETEQLRAALRASQNTIASQAGLLSQQQGQIRAANTGALAAEEARIDTGISQAETEANAAQERWTALQAEGNFAEAGKAMRDMTSAQSRSQSLKDRKIWIGQQREAADRQPAPTAAPATNLTAAEQAWISRNPAYVNDPTFARKANVAAGYARDVLNLPQDSEEYFKHIERAVYPGRHADPAAVVADPGAARGGTVQPPAAPNGGGDGDSPLSGADDDGLDPPISFDQQHTLEASPVSNTRDAPVMRIDATPGAGPDAPQTPPPARAIGKGNDGIRSIAAPPSRQIREASQRSAQRTGGRIEPTMQELETARSLYDSIEPNAADRTDETIIRWYHALAHSPTHNSTRRRVWAREAVV